MTSTTATVRADGADAAKAGRRRAAVLSSAVLDQIADLPIGNAETIRVFDHWYAAYDAQVDLEAAEVLS